VELVASQEISGHPKDIECQPDGHIVVLMATRDQILLYGFDPWLTQMWSRQVNGLALTRAPNGTIWLLEPFGATVVTDQREECNRVAMDIPQGMMLGAFAALEDGFIFACEHVATAPMHTPIVSRVSLDGEVCWSSTLPVETLSYRGVVQMSRDEGWKPRPMDPWTPRSWVTNPDSVQISDDAVLVRFSDKWGSGIGIGYVLSMDDGELLFLTKQGPIQEVAPLGKGEFLVGFQGYGAFETLRYERNGQIQLRWPTHGHYAVTGEGVRVIEMENISPSKMHLVRMLSDGNIEKGAWLDGYYTSRPFCHTDGTLFFCRNGAVLGAKNLRIERRLDLGCLGETFSTKIVAKDRSLYFAFRERNIYVTRLCRVDF
jgi:hypothetical protein